MTIIDDEMEINCMSAMPEMLLSWYDLSSRKLPWRDDPTPYRVWVSEIMLQQTRVSAVIPYFQRFMEQLPTVHDLANVDEMTLSKLWEGLGYYSRMRNLQRAAQIIVSELGGDIPDTPKTLAELPGIGTYTAGAICSIAYQKPYPAVDGNVLRVLSRVLCCREDITRASVKAAFAEWITRILPANRPGDFNQAMMELGAMVCVPNGSPNCDICPLCGICKAHSLHIETQLPQKTPKRPRRIEHKQIQILICRHRVLLKKRPATGVLAGLWEFCPAPHDQPLNIKEQRPLPSSKHIFSHLEWKMDAVAFYIEDPIHLEDSVWASLDEIKHVYSLPTAFRTYRALLPALLG